MPHPVKVTGVGSYAPAKVLTNTDLEKMMDTSDEWITTRTGIRERHITAADEATSDMALAAARQALAMGGVRAEDVGYIVVGTVTPDMPFPSAACLVQDHLGAKNAGAMDVGAGCTGFLYAFQTGVALVASGMHDKVLVIGADTLSRILDWTDRSTAVLLGDGAGAVVLERARKDEPHVMSTYTGSDGSLWELLHMPAGGSRLRASAETVEKGLHSFKMRGNSTFRQAVEIMGEACQKALDDAGLSLSDIDFVIPHQANLRIINALASRLDIPDDKLVITVDRYGNTSAAACPMALSDVVKEGRVKRGDTILMVSFGAGLTWGATVFGWYPPA